MFLFMVFIFQAGANAKPTNKAAYMYFVPKIHEVSFLMPAGKTIPFDWKVAEIKPKGEGISLNWDTKLNAKNKQVFFRLTSATDVRENCTLELLLSQSLTVIGILDIRFAH